MVRKGNRKLPESDPFPLIEKALSKRTKVELVAIMLAIAREHPIVVRELENRLTIVKPADLLAADLSSAIDRATGFDERLLNHNFDVDWNAYAEVQKGLLRLVDLNQLADAKSLALKLMKAGSHQVECSDEGLMSDEICQCLMPVIQAVQAAGGVEAVKWAGKMLTADCVGCICDQELKELRDKS